MLTLTIAFIDILYVQFINSFPFCCPLRTSYWSFWRSVQTACGKQSVTSSSPTSTSLLSPFMRSAETLRYKLSSSGVLLSHNNTMLMWPHSWQLHVEIVIHFMTVCRNWPICMTRCTEHTAKWQRSCTQARDCWEHTLEWLSLARWVHWCFFFFHFQTVNLLSAQTVTINYLNILSHVFKSQKTWDLFKAFWPSLIHLSAFFILFEGSGKCCCS